MSNGPNVTGMGTDDRFGVVIVVVVEGMWRYMLEYGVFSSRWLEKLWMYGWIVMGLGILDGDWDWGYNDVVIVVVDDDVDVGGGGGN